MGYQCPYRSGERQCVPALSCQRHPWSGASWGSLGCGVGCGSAKASLLRSPLCAGQRGQSAADPATEPAGPRLRAPRAARLGSVIKGLLLAFRASVSTAVKRGSYRSHGRAVRCSVRMYKVRAWPGRCPTRGSLCLCVSSLGQGGLTGAAWSG